MSTEKRTKNIPQVPAGDSDNHSRPHEIYRLAVIVEGLLDSANDPDALKTIRGELRELINDLAPVNTR